MYIPFRFRLILSLGILIALVLGLTLSSLSTFQEIQEGFAPLGFDIIPRMVFLLNTRANILELQTVLERTVATGDNSYLVRSQQLIPEILTAVANHVQHETQIGASEGRAAQEIEEDINRIIELLDEFAEASKIGDRSAEQESRMALLRAQSDVALNDLSYNIDRRLNLQIIEINTVLQNISGRISQSIRYLLIGSILAPLLATLIAIMVIRMVMDPITTLEKGAQHFAAGNLQHRIRNSNSPDIFNRLIDAFNEMADKIVQRESELKTANANLEIIVAERTKRTEQALQEAEAANQALEEKIRITLALGRLNERMRGDIGLYSLAANAIREICEEMDAQVGIIYLRNEEEPTPSFIIGASYAYAPHSERPAQFQAGEGLLGQVVRDRQTIHLERADLQDLRIVTGVGNAVPMATVIAPILFNDQVIAVFEAASIRGFTPQNQEYLHSALETIAIAFHTAQVRGQIDELLAKTKHQASQLRKIESKT